VRLHVVALACEIAVLADLMEPDLAVLHGDPVAQDIRQGCLEHRRAAESVLAREASSADVALEALCRMAHAFRTRVVDMRDLREHLACMTEDRPARSLQRPGRAARMGAS
jgi:hypothetical protein